MAGWIAPLIGLLGSAGQQIAGAFDAEEEAKKRREEEERQRAKDKALQRQAPATYKDMGGDMALDTGAGRGMGSVALRHEALRNMR